MLTLYYRPGCPYCEKVMETADELGVILALKDINEPGVAKELIERGGKQQMPYLVDDEEEVEMYESEDIIAYLHKRFG